MPIFIGRNKAYLKLENNSTNFADLEYLVKRKSPFYNRGKIPKKIRVFPLDALNLKYINFKLLCKQKKTVAIFLLRRQQFYY